MRNFMLFWALALFFCSCQDKVPIVVPTSNPLNVFPQNFRRNVLLENVVGEWHAATVENSVMVAQLQAQFGSRLIVSTLHQNDWLETAYTTYFIDRLGGLIGIPRAAINRRKGSGTILGEDNLVLLSPENWTTAIERAMATPAFLAISMETSVDSAHQATVNVNIAHKEAIFGDIRLLVYIVQNDIPALFQQGGTTTFKHQNVLKEVLTSYEGDTLNLNEDFPLGEIRHKQFTGINLTNYDVFQTRAIAVVYRYDVDFRKSEILNVQEVRMGGIKFWDL
ncbi:MAG: Omp28-related outer membrane protein [Chitinophagaceae bacterium]|nr:Omp28-related outer membrane protein [Chitinophagaceae bacterium]